MRGVVSRRLRDRVRSCHRLPRQVATSALGYRKGQSTFRDNCAARRTRARRNRIGQSSLKAGGTRITLLEPCIRHSPSVSSARITAYDTGTCLPRESAVFRAAVEPKTTGRRWSRQSPPDPLKQVREVVGGTLPMIEKLLPAGNRPVVADASGIFDRQRRCQLIVRGL